MPRTSTSQRERKDAELVSRIDAYSRQRIRSGARCEDVAKSLGFKSKGTLYNRLKTPEAFTLAELHAIASCLNISIGALLGEGTPG